MLRMYDFPEASAHSPRREPTTTPLQQLFVLNSPWMKQQAAALWERVKSIEDNDQRVAFSYRLLFAREPQSSEVDLARRFFETEAAASDTVNDEESRWKDYLQALLGLNEFHVVD